MKKFMKKINFSKVYKEKDFKFIPSIKFKVLAEV